MEEARRRQGGSQEEAMRRLGEGEEEARRRLGGGQAEVRMRLGGGWEVQGRSKEGPREDFGQIVGGYLKSMIWKVWAGNWGLRPENSESSYLFVLENDRTSSGDRSRMIWG